MNAVTETRPAGIDAAEWQVRCDLAALYRLIAHFRWTDLIYTHISARLPVCPTGRQGMATTTSSSTSTACSSTRCAPATW